MTFCGDPIYRVRFIAISFRYRESERIEQGYNQSKCDYICTDLKGVAINRTR